MPSHGVGGEGVGEGVGEGEMGQGREEGSGRAIYNL